MNALKQKLHDTQGASIVIALVFFLICAVVGSTVLTAATINSQSTATYRNSRQQDFAVSSAANVLGTQLQEGITVEWEYGNTSDSSTPTGTTITGTTTNSLAEQIWELTGTSSTCYKIWVQNQARDSYIIGGNNNPLEIEPTSADMDPVYATIQVGPNYSLLVTLSLDSDMSTASPYNEQIEIQCIPTYDGDGRIMKLQWAAPIVTKQDGMVSGS